MMPPWSDGTRPSEKCQRQIDGGGVKRIAGVFQIQSEVFARIERPGLAHEYLDEVFPDAPIPLLVNIRKCGFRHRLAESQVVHP